MQKRKSSSGSHPAQKHSAPKLQHMQTVVLNPIPENDAEPSDVDSEAQSAQEHEVVAPPSFCDTIIEKMITQFMIIELGATLTPGICHGRFCRLCGSDHHQDAWSQVPRTYRVILQCIGCFGGNCQNLLCSCDDSTRWDIMAYTQVNRAIHEEFHIRYVPGCKHWLQCVICDRARPRRLLEECDICDEYALSLIHISEPTRPY